METNSHIYQLIQLEFEGQLLDEQKSELRKWMEESSDHTTEYQQIRKSFILTERLAAMKKIDTKGDLLKVKANFSKNSGMKRWLTSYQRIAAILLVPFIVYSVWSFYTNAMGTGPSISMKSMETSYGVRSQILLADGTKVFLNSGSKLFYPEEFTGNTREVRLEGEAYFEVESDVKHPFYVELGGMKLKATGTKFNITNYQVGQNAYIFLEHGKVELVTGFGAKEVQQVIMKEGEVVMYNRVKRQYQVNGTDGQRYLGWKEGKLIFRNDNIRDVASRLGYWYNAEITVTDETLYEYIFTATFKYETLEEALKLLSYSSPISYRIETSRTVGHAEMDMKKVIIEKKEDMK